jgi:glycerol-3-phosphate acyltransferase PlsX
LQIAAALPWYKEGVITVAVDAMGGEQAPDEIVRGVANLSLEAEKLQLLLVGDERQITDLLSRLPHNPESIEVLHAGGSLPRTSVFTAVRLAAERQVDAVVSAGTIADALAACREHLELLPGVTAPALAAVYPTALRRGRNADPFSLILDVGATLEPSADQLCTFAGLGSVYARAISRNPRPRVALLSIDKDPARGLPTISAAHARLRAAPGIDFVGNIEAVDIPSGEADVVVCGGFVGNVVITLLDGVNELVVDLAKYGQKQRLLWRAGLAMLSGGVNQLKELTDWEQYGGAPLLGFNRLLLRAHPKSGARAIQNACRVAAKAVAADLPAGFAELQKEQTPQAAKVVEGAA